MSRVIVAAPPHAAPGPPPAPAGPLRLVRRIGYAVLGLQLAGFLVWSTIQYHRFALTWDFTIYHQAWYLIAHGNLDPYNSVQGYPFWQNHSEFLLWPLALFYWVWPHDVVLLWLQDVCVVGAELVAFTWLCDLAQRYRPGRDAAWLAGAGLVLLAVNPWTWWALAWDFHTETLAILFLTLLACDLANGRHRAWAWVVPLLACGDVAATYLAGLGLAGVLAGRSSRLRGAVMASLGVGVTLFITLVHANKGSGSGLQAYDYLAGGPPAVQLSLAALAKGIATHPLGAVRALWAKRLDTWANIAPSGLLGVGFVWLLPVSVIVLLANGLFSGPLFAAPGFQNLPFYVLLPAGTVAVLGCLANRYRRMALLLTGLVVVQALVWAAIWVPRTSSQWLRVSGPAAATLAGIEARIPASADVSASQGVSGRFSGRMQSFPLNGPGQLPVYGETWFVIAPLAGIETQSTASAQQLIGALAGPLHATLITHANGVWAFRWRPPPGVQRITVPDGAGSLPAWATPGAAGREVLTGPPAEWHVTSAGTRGYVAEGLSWQEPPGRYQALVRLSATGRVNVEVWNDAGDTLLARRSIPSTTGVETIAMATNIAAPHQASAYSGWGPFQASFLPPPVGNRLEVRVWSPGGGAVNVYSAELVSEGRNAPSRLPVP